MSDYLSNLVARNLGLAEVLQPRLASRFEPASLGWRPIFKVWGSDNGQTSGMPGLDNLQFINKGEKLQPPSGPPHTFDALREAIRDFQAGSGRRSNPLRSRHPEEEPFPSAGRKIPKDVFRHREAGQSMPPFPSTSSSLEQSVDTQPSAAKSLVMPDPDQPTLEPINRHVKVERAVPVGLPGQSRIEEPADVERFRPKRAAEEQMKSFQEPVIKQIQIEKVISEPLLVATGDEKRSTMEPTVQTIKIERISEATSRMPVSPPFESVSVKISQPSIHPLKPRAIMAQPFITKYNQRVRAGITESGLKPKPEPSIQVTIGSIEVRAVPPTARPKNERHAPPVMSLEEYLHSRGGSR